MSNSLVIFWLPIGSNLHLNFLGSNRTVVSCSRLCILRAYKHIQFIRRVKKSYRQVKMANSSSARRDEKRRFACVSTEERDEPLECNSERRRNRQETPLRKGRPYQ